MNQVCPSRGTVTAKNARPLAARIGTHQVHVVPNEPADADLPAIPFQLLLVDRAELTWSRQRLTFASRPPAGPGSMVIVVRASRSPS